MIADPIERNRLDVLLKRALPPSYKTRAARYRRALEALLAVRDEQGERLYSREEAEKVLAIYAGIGRPIRQLISLLHDGLEQARVDASRKAISRVRRDAEGKFRKSKKRLARWER